MGDKVSKAAEDIGKGVAEVGEFVGKGAAEVGEFVGKGVAEVGEFVGKGAAEVGEFVGGKGVGEVAKDVAVAPFRAVEEIARAPAKVAEEIAKDDEAEPFRAVVAPFRAVVAPFRFVAGVTTEVAAAQLRAADVVARAPSRLVEGCAREVLRPKISSLPSNFQDILKDADSPVLKSSGENLHDQLYSGVFLRNKTMKYWVDKKFNCNCFMLYAKALSINCSDSPSYWKWVRLEESRGITIEVAELKEVSWLEISGRFDTRKLTPGILYEVSFHVMMKDSSYGWEVPVTLRLVLSGGKKKKHRESLKDKMRGRWMEIPVGQFVASGKEDDGGDMEVSMRGSEGRLWKSGLVVKGVVIRPTSAN